MPPLKAAGIYKGSCLTIRNGKKKEKKRKKKEPLVINYRQLQIPRKIARVLVQAMYWSCSKGKQ